MGKVISGLFGGGSDPGMLGTGMFRAGLYDIDRKRLDEADVRLDPQQQAAREQQARLAQQLEQFGMGQAQTQAMQQAQDVRGDQMGLAQALQAQAAGQGPSVAGMQLQQSTDRGLAQAAGLAASQRGVNPALAARQAQQAQAQIQQGAGRDAAQLRVQEQLAGQQQLAQQLQGVRAQDQSVADAQRAERAQAASVATGMRAQDVSAVDSDRAARLAAEQMDVQQRTAQQQTQAQAYSDAAARRQGVLGGIGEALSVFSDENKKKLVDDQEAPTKTQQFVKKLGSSIADSVPTPAYQQSRGYQSGKAMGKGLSKGIKGLIDGPVTPPVGAGAAKGAAAAGAAKGGMLAKALPFLAALSDKDKKEQIEEVVENKLTDFVDALNAHQYEYTDDVKDIAGEGTYVSPMAQELEQTELGKDMVIDTPEGKMVDYGKGFGTMLASQAVLNDRLAEIEEALKLKKERK